VHDAAEDGDDAEDRVDGSGGIFPCIENSGKAKEEGKTEEAGADWTWCGECFRVDGNCAIWTVCEGSVADGIDGRVVGGAERKQHGED